MKLILVMGAGRMGRKVIDLLRNDYEIIAIDTAGPIIPGIETRNGWGDFDRLVTAADAVVSTLHAHSNIAIVKACLSGGTHYFDITEDVAANQEIRDLVHPSMTPNMFFSQCGLAPGVVSIAAGTLGREYDFIDSIECRVGALPRHPRGPLGYALTRSTDGLINEYINPAQAVVDQSYQTVQSMDGLETMVIEGTTYEAFNTSGGLGDLWDAFTVRDMNYKTLRYPGHCAAMRLLLDTFDFRNQRDDLKELLERTVPTTDDDVVVLHVSVTGWKDHSRVYSTRTFEKVIYAQDGWTAIQRATAGSLAAVVDMALTGELNGVGIMSQHDVPLGKFLQNKHGRIYA